MGGRGYVFLYIWFPFLHLSEYIWGRHGHDRNVVVGFTLLPVQSVPIITEVVSSNPVHGEVYLLQHFVIKFVSELQQVRGFLRQ